MTASQIEDEVVRIVRAHNADLADIEITAEMSFVNLGLDSLTRIDVLSDAESAFDISVADEVVATLVTIKDVVDYVAAARVA